MRRCVYAEAKRSNASGVRKERPYALMRFDLYGSAKRSSAADTVFIEHQVTPFASVTQPLTSLIKGISLRGHAGSSRSPAARRRAAHLAKSILMPLTSTAAFASFLHELRGDSLLDRFQMLSTIDHRPSGATPAWCPSWSGDSRKRRANGAATCLSRLAGLTSDAQRACNGAVRLCRGVCCSTELLYSRWVLQLSSSSAFSRLFRLTTVDRNCCLYYD